MQKYLNLLKLGVLTTLGTLTLLTVSVVAPSLHGKYIRNKVGSRVVMVLNDKENSGGTGFSVVTQKGNSYILTNAHVCELQTNGIVTVKLNNGQSLPRRVLNISKETDLCLVENVPNYNGLTLGSSLSVGDELGLVGHPKLIPLTLMRGQLVGFEDVLVMAAFGPCTPEIKGPVKTIPSLFGPVCIMNIKKAGLTNITALPGNSGSPVVNFFGNVIGVLFAATQENWGIVIPLRDVKKFLKDW